MEPIMKVSGRQPGLNPIKDADVIRVPIPPLSEPARARQPAKFGEEGKSQSGTSAGMIDHLRIGKAEHFSEDERNKGSRRTKMTDKGIKEIDTLLTQKEKEIMEV
jgi:ribosome recycling factor